MVLENTGCEAGIYPEQDTHSHTQATFTRLCSSDSSLMFSIFSGLCGHTNPDLSKSALSHFLYVVLNLLRLAKVELMILLSLISAMVAFLSQTVGTQAAHQTSNARELQLASCLPFYHAHVNYYCLYLVRFKTISRHTKMFFVVRDTDNCF